MEKKNTGTQSRYAIGIDLGQKQDYTAIAALEVVDIVYDRRDPISYDFELAPLSCWGRAAA